MCPNCNSPDCVSNLINETPFRAAARRARMLRQLGQVGEAADVLTRLATIRIINFLRAQWRCVGCGVAYDD